MADGTVQRWTCSDGDAGAEMWRDNVDGAYVLYSDYVAAVIAVRTSLIEAGGNANDPSHRDFWAQISAAVKDSVTKLSWHLIAPDNPPKPFIHEVWCLHIGIKIVENWMPAVREVQGGWNGAGYTHMRLLNIPMPKKEEGR